MLPVALVHELIPALPFLGDTTNTQALIFSPPFSPIESSPSMYPNYTLPPANLSTPSPPSSPPTFSLVIAPTSSGLASGMQTACSINSTSPSGLVVSNDLWLRNNHGWRSQWLIDDLTPSTNYTAYVIQDQVKLSGPIYFTTKSCAFSSWCGIHSLTSPHQHHSPAPSCTPFHFVHLHHTLFLFPSPNPLPHPTTLQISHRAYQIPFFSI